MNKAHAAIIGSLLLTSAVAWAASLRQPDMMAAMTTYNPVAVCLFTASWTAGMAAMMFPAIIPMVLLYNTFLMNKNKGDQTSVTIQGRPKSSSIVSVKIMLFVGCYLLVWATTGIGLLLGWALVMNSTIMSSNNANLIPALYGSLLITAGVYQFTPLKRSCIGYCESPMGFFVRRWRDGTSGAVRMGLWHGAYCLGCCWSYFLLMVALGWMNILWMGLFAGIIFAEKVWRKGLWVARGAGAGLAITGILVLSGLMPTLIPSMSLTNMSPGSNSNNMGPMVADSTQNSAETGKALTAQPSTIGNNTAHVVPTIPNSDSMQNSSSQGMHGMKILS